MKNFELLNNLLTNGAVSTVEEFTFLWENSYLDTGDNTLNIRTKEGTIITCNLTEMVETIDGYMETDLINMFKEFGKPLPIYSKYNNLDEIIKDLRDFNKEDEFRRNAAEHANIGLGKFFLLYQLKIDDEFRLYLEYMPSAYPDFEKKIAFEIYYSDGDDAFMEHNYDTHEVTRLDIE